MDQPWSAVQDVQQRLGLPVVAIAGLADLLAYLDAAPAWPRIARPCKPIGSAMAFDRLAASILLLGVTTALAPAWAQRTHCRPWHLYLHHARWYAA